MEELTKHWPPKIVKMDNALKLEKKISSLSYEQ